MIGALSAVTYDPHDWTSGDVAFITTLATHAAIALTNAELFEQTEARAAQLGVLQAASARLSRAGTVEQVGRTVVEETRRIIDYHNARVYLIEPPDRVVPIAFEGRIGAYEKVDFELLRCRLGEGFTGWVAQHGEPLLIDDANADPAARPSRAPTTSTSRCSSCRCATTRRPSASSRSPSSASTSSTGTTCGC